MIQLGITIPIGAIYVKKTNLRVKKVCTTQ